MSETDDKNLLDCAARVGHLHVCKWLIDNKFRVSSVAWSPPFGKCAAAAGRMDIFEWAMAQGYQLTYDAMQIEETFGAAAFKGHLLFIEALAKKVHGEPPYERMAQEAIRESQIPLLDWLIKSSPELNFDGYYRFALTSSKGRGIAAMEWLLNRLKHVNITMAQVSRCIRARCDLMALDWLFDHGLPKESSLTYDACLSSDPKVIEHLVRRGVPLHFQATAAAASRGTLSIIEALRANIAISFIISSFLMHLCFLLVKMGALNGNQLTTKAAGKHYMSLLQWALDHGFAFSGTELQHYIEHGLIRSVSVCYPDYDFIIRHGGATTIDEAAIRGCSWVKFSQENVDWFAQRGVTIPRTDQLEHSDEEDDDM